MLGLGFMLMGENSHEVTWAHEGPARRDQGHAAAERRRRRRSTTAPSWSITSSTRSKNNLFEGGLLVVAVLFAFLGNLRAAVIVALAIPLSMLFAFCGMLRFGIAASLLSLGAIDFGMIVDSSVVMIENCVRHIAARRQPAADA